MQETVPFRFRGPLAAVVQRIADGDYDGLAQAGSVPNGKDLAMWIRQYPGRVVPLPPEAWQLAQCGRVTTERGAWWVVIPLWTAEEGRSDLSLGATIRELTGRIAIKIDGIHVL